MVDDRQQLKLLKRQFDELVRDEAASYNSIDDVLDDAIRRRFAETISALITANSRAQHRTAKVKPAIASGPANHKTRHFVSAK